MLIVATVLMMLAVVVLATEVNNAVPWAPAWPTRELSMVSAGGGHLIST